MNIHYYYSRCKYGYYYAKIIHTLRRYDYYVYYRHEYIVSKYANTIKCMLDKQYMDKKTRMLIGNM